MRILSARGDKSFGSPFGEPLEWPLGDLAEFGDVPVSPLQTPPLLPSGRCGVVDGEDLATVLEVASSATNGTPWRSNDKLYNVRFRPLLEGETGCAANPAP